MDINIFLDFVSISFSVMASKRSGWVFRKHAGFPERGKYFFLILPRLVGEKTVPSLISFIKVVVSLLKPLKQFKLATQYEG